MTIINLTRDPATAEQRAAGVVDIVSPALWEELLALLTFEHPLTEREWTELTADGGPVTSGYRHIGFVPVRT